MSELGDECWFERHDHPLMNRLILDIVFKNLRGKDLKECRLVCKTWNAATIPFTRNAFEMRIWNSDSMEDFVSVRRSNNLGIPCVKFQLGPSFLTGEIGQEFLQLCGGVIKSMKCISGCNFMVNDLSALLKSTPKLEIFETPKFAGGRNYSVTNLFPEGTKPRLASLQKLTVSDYNFGKRNKYCPTFLEELITAAENISILHLNDEVLHSTFSGVSVSASLEVLSIIEKLGRESSIQELTTRVRIGNYSNFFELLHKMIQKPNGLKLKSFGYTFCMSEGECQRLMQLISLFKDTLEYLRIDGIYSNHFAQLPKMSRLTGLSMSLVTNHNSRFVNLKEFFPVLKELKVWQHSHQVLKEFFPESEPCPIVNSLKLRNVFFEINGFRQVLKVFPNLTRLTMNVREDTLWILREIWSEMRQLQSLSISGEIHNMSNLDSYFNGGALQRIVDAFHHMEGMTALGRQDKVLKLMTRYCHLPSIVNLTELRSLTLDVVVKGDWPRPAWKGLTDLTGYLALYPMKCLRHLTVNNCEFTKTCCEILTQDLGLQSWSFMISEREIIPSQ